MCWWVLKTPDSVALRLMSTLLNFDFTALNIFVLLSLKSFNVASPRSAWQESITMFHSSTQSDGKEILPQFSHYCSVLRVSFLLVLVIGCNCVVFLFCLAFLYNCIRIILWPVLLWELRLHCVLADSISKLSVTEFALWDLLQSSLLNGTPLQHTLE